MYWTSMSGTCSISIPSETEVSVGAAAPAARRGNRVWVGMASALEEERGYVREKPLKA